MRAAVVCATLAVVLLPVRAGAQSLSLTEAQALERLSPDSPRVRAMRAATDVARAEVRAAGRWPNPRLTFDREAVAGTTEYMTMVSQSLPLNGARGLQVQAATALADASTGRVDDEFRRARADLRLAYAQLVAVQVRERELTAARDRVRLLAEVLAKREAAGDAAGFDRLRVERELLDLDADLALAGTDRTRAQATLTSFFAGPLDANRIVAVSASNVHPPLPTVEALVERAESVRGDLRALTKEKQAAGFAEQAAGRRRIPDPEIVGGTKTSSFATGDVGTVFMVHAAVPLFDRSQADRAVAQARAQLVEARAEVFRVSLRAQIVAVRAVVEQRRAIADRYRRSAGSDQIERIAQVSYDAGERGILELLDAFRTGSAGRLRQALLDAAVRDAEIELEFLSGWELPS